MFAWLSSAVANATAAVVFFSIFLFGLIFSVLSLFFGGHGDHDSDTDADGDADSDSDADHDSGHADGGAETAISAFQGVNLGMLSLRGICLLSVGLGGIGFLVQVYTGKVLFSTVSGLLSGYVFAFAILYLLRVFRSQQANSLLDHSGAVGGQAVVTVSIPERGPGEIRVVIADKEVYKTATSSDGTPIRAGSLVRVVSVGGGSAVVSIVDPSLKNAGL